MEVKEILTDLRLSMLNHMKDGKFITRDGSVNFDASKGKHWVTYITKFCFDSQGSRPLKLLADFVYKSNGDGVCFSIINAGKSQIERCLLLTCYLLN